MSDDYTTLGVQQSVNRLAIARAQQAIAATGRALPCAVVAVLGSLVTVSLEVQGPWTLPQITIPKAESQWLRTPTQVGDVGMTVPADTSLGGISGQGAGVADLTVDYGNLTTLVFIPVATTRFAPNTDPTKAWINGPGGARIGDSASGTFIDVDALGVITIVAGGKTWTFGADGLTLSTAVIAETHIHTTPSGPSGPPESP